MILRRRLKQTNPTIIYGLDKNGNPKPESALIISPNSEKGFELGLIMPNGERYHQVTNYNALDREIDPKYDKLKRVVETLTGLESKAA